MRAGNASAAPKGGGGSAAAGARWDDGRLCNPVDEDLERYVERLYSEHHGSLLRYLLMSGCPAPDADDYLQDGFLRLLQFLKQGGSVERPKAWLIRVLHNLKTDDNRLRSRRAGAGDIDFELQLATAVDTVPDAEAQALEQERYEQLRKAVSRLSPRQYQYLTMRAAGLKLREIAESCGVTVQTVAEACARVTERLGRLTRE